MTQYVGGHLASPATSTLPITLKGLVWLLPSKNIQIHKNLPKAYLVSNRIVKYSLPYPDYFNCSLNLFLL